MIKRNNMRMTVMSVAIGLALLTGCGTTNTSSTNSGSVTSSVEETTLNVATSSDDIQVEYAEDDYYTEWKNEKVTTVTLNGSTINVDGVGAEVQDSTLTIASGGTYVISGQLTDGQIIVDSADKQTVRLILNGVEINCSNSAPIYVKQAEKVVLSLEQGTTNKMSDTEHYVLEEGSDEPDAAIFSKADLIINGAGTLTIAANYNNGITSKDDLKIMEGTMNISAVGDAIKGKDMVAIKDGNITIDATEDGIKSTNSTDADKGFIYIEGGKINITAGNDGIQAETDIKILGGDFKLNTGGGSSNGVSHAEGFGGGFRGQAGETGGGMGNRPKGEGMIRPEDAGTIKPADEGIIVPENAGMNRPEKQVVHGNVDSSSNAVQTPEVTDEANTSEHTIGNISDVTTEETASDSHKGIKATQTITIEGGTFNINAADDAIHSNDSIVIQNGDFVIETGDDGIHADTLLTIAGGLIHINNSYEGLEAAQINIIGGTTYVTASDDGVNASDGSTETLGGRPGEGSATAQITISGGYLCVDADGDGIDSNGSVTMTDGTVVVNGPVNGGNGALDYDGSFEISGGTLIAAGSAQMAQAPSSTSSQKIVAITFTSNQEMNSIVNLQNEIGNTILSFAPSKSYQSVIISSPLLEEGKTYSFSYGGSMSGDAVDGLYEVGVYTGGTKVTDFTISDSITYLSETGVTTGDGFGQGGGMRPAGGQREKLERHTVENESKSLQSETVS